MSEKIQLKDVIHFYLGATLQSTTGNVKLMAVVKEIIPSSSFAIAVINGNTSYTTELGEYKPILRPLSSMTAEEMIELLQSIVPPDLEVKPGNDDYDMDMFYNDGGLMVDGNVAVGANVSCICWEAQVAIRLNGDIDFFDENGEREKVVNQAAAFRYMLSKHFDIFGLIESGQAIDKSKPLPHVNR